MNKQPKSYSIPLPTSYKEIFQKIPENGMGYHRVNIVLDDGTKIRGALVNIEKILYQHTSRLTTTDIKSIKSLDNEISK